MELTIAAIKDAVRQRQFYFSAHAEEARMDDNLTAAEVLEAILNDDILEQYPDTGRGQSCLVMGFSGEQALHVVCGVRGEALVIITVYIPGPPHFSDPRTRVREEQL
jgi:hypothetical protein